VEKDNCSQIITVWHPKPGDGGSFTALNLFNLLKKELTEEKICLADFDIPRPYLRYYLRLDECTVIDNLRPYIAAGNLIGKILEQVAVRINKNASFIGGVKRIENPDKYTDNHFKAIIEVSREVYDHIVIDAGSLPDNAGTIEALRQADIVIMLIKPSFISQVYMEQLLGLLPGMGIEKEKIWGVINGYQSEIISKPETILSKENIPLLCTLPELGVEGLIAVNESRPLSCNVKTVIEYNNNLKNGLVKIGLLKEYKDEGRANPLLRLIRRQK